LLGTIEPLRVQVSFPLKKTCRGIVKNVKPGGWTGITEQNSRGGRMAHTIQTYLVSGLTELMQEKTSLIVGKA